MLQASCKPMSYGDLALTSRSDNNYCPPRSRCVQCSDGSGICCRGSSGDYVEPIIVSTVATVTYPPDSETTSYSTSDDVSYSTSDYTYTYHSYFYTTYIFWYITWIPLYTPTTSSTVTTTTTLSAFATDSIEASSSFSADVVAIQSDVSFSQSLYSPETLAPASTSSSAPATFDSSSASGSTSAAASAHSNLVAGIFGFMSLAVGVLAIML